MPCVPCAGVLGTGVPCARVTMSPVPPMCPCPLCPVPLSPVHMCRCPCARYWHPRCRCLPCPCPRHRYPQSPCAGVPSSGVTSRSVLLFPKPVSPVPMYWCPHVLVSPVPVSTCAGVPSAGVPTRAGSAEQQCPGTAGMPIAAAVSPAVPRSPHPRCPPSPPPRRMMAPRLSQTHGPWCEPRTRRRRNLGASSPWVRVGWGTAIPGQGLSPPAHTPSPVPVPAGLSYPVFKGIMKKGYKVPTPIQRKVSVGGCGTPAPGWWDGDSDTVSHRASLPSCVAGTWWRWRGRAAGRQPASSSPCSSG